MKDLVKQEAVIAISVAVIIAIGTYCTISDDPFGMKEFKAFNAPTTTIDVKCNAVTHHLLKNGKCTPNK